MNVHSDQIHLGQVPDSAVLDSLADFICGDGDKYPLYRKGYELTTFFESVGIKASHDGSTRKWWTLAILQQLSPEEIERVILKLVDFKVYKAVRDNHTLSVRAMNDILLMENLEIRFAGVVPYIRRGKGISFSDADFSAPKDAQSENLEEFLKKQFPENIQIDELVVDPTISTYLQSRVDEVKACPKEQAPLAIIFLLGSTLEGILLAVALAGPTKYVACPAAPKDRHGVVRPLHDWKLNDLIEVSHALRLLDLDVQKHSHTLRQFRNYIHPYEQMSKHFAPDHHTAEISWHVFRAAFYQLKKNKHLLS